MLRSVTQLPKGVKQLTLSVFHYHKPQSGHIWTRGSNDATMKSLQPFLTWTHFQSSWASCPFFKQMNSSEMFLVLLSLREEKSSQRSPLLITVSFPVKCDDDICVNDAGWLSRKQEVKWLWGQRWREDGIESDTTCCTCHSTVLTCSSCVTHPRLLHVCKETQTLTANFSSVKEETPRTNK